MVIARNVIENNLIWNTGDHGIQAAADAIIRGNYIADAAGCGIYSREHQKAVPGNLLIEGNYIIARKNAALRIIGSKATSNREKIKLLGNRLFAENGHLAIRIDNDASIWAEQNGGQGKTVGSNFISSQWRNMKKPNPVNLPPLSDHVAWKTIPRNVVEAIFRTRP